MTALPVAREGCALPGSPLEAERAGLDSCVHCGFCLQACPTYLALEDENDSPRGRLLLMGALLDGTVAPTDEVVGRHLDQCLGCRGCETACPAGVPYGRLLEARARLEAAEGRALSDDEIVTLLCDAAIGPTAGPAQEPADVDLAPDPAPADAPPPSQASLRPADAPAAPRPRLRFH